LLFLQNIKPTVDKIIRNKNEERGAEMVKLDWWKLNDCGLVTIKILELYI
jgi:hypothetical protein